MSPLKFAGAPIKCSSVTCQVDKTRNMSKFELPIHFSADVIDVAQWPDLTSFEVVKSKRIQ